MYFLLASTTSSSGLGSATQDSWLLIISESQGTKCFKKIRVSSVICWLINYHACVVYSSSSLNIFSQHELAWGWFPNFQEDTAFSSFQCAMKRGQRQNLSEMHHKKHFTTCFHSSYILCVIMQEKTRTVKTLDWNDPLNGTVPPKPLLCWAKWIYFKKCTSGIQDEMIMWKETCELDLLLQWKVSSSSFSNSWE